MPYVIDPAQSFIGAARVWNRAIGGTGDWTDMGVLLDNQMVRVGTSWFRPENLAGVLGPIMGLDILRTVIPEIEFTCASVNGASMAKILPGSVSSARATTDSGGSPLTTTLAVAALAGEVNVKVAAVTNATAGDFIRIGSGATVEYRQITTAGTALAGGTGLTFREPLLFPHALAEVVVETVGDGRTLIGAPVTRRQPTTAYYDWALMAPTGNAWGGIEVYNALSVTEQIEIEFGDEVLSGIRATIQGRYSGSALTTSPFQIIVPT